MDNNPKDKTDADLIAQEWARKHFEFPSLDEHRQEFYEATLSRLHLQKPDGEREQPKPAYKRGQRVYLDGKTQYIICGIFSIKSESGEFQYQLCRDLWDKGTILRGIFKESRLSLLL